MNESLSNLPESLPPNERRQNLLDKSVLLRVVDQISLFQKHEIVNIIGKDFNQGKNVPEIKSFIDQMLNNPIQFNYELQVYDPERKKPMAEIIVKKLPTNEEGFVASVEIIDYFYPDLLEAEDSERSDMPEYRLKIASNVDDLVFEEEVQVRQMDGTWQNILVFEKGIDEDDRLVLLSRNQIDEVEFLSEILIFNLADEQAQPERFLVEEYFEDNDGVLYQNKLDVYFGSNGYHKAQLEQKSGALPDGTRLINCRIIDFDQRIINQCPDHSYLLDHLRENLIPNGVDLSLQTSPYISTANIRFFMSYGSNKIIGHDSDQAEKHPVISLDSTVDLATRAMTWDDLCKEFATVRQMDKGLNPSESSDQRISPNLQNFYENFYRYSRNVGAKDNLFVIAEHLEGLLIFVVQQSDSQVIYVTELNNNELNDAGFAKTTYLGENIYHNEYQN